MFNKVNSVSRRLDNAFIFIRSHKKDIDTLKERVDKLDKRAVHDCVPCGECGVIVLKSHAHKIKDNRRWRDEPPYYCQEHAPPFDRIEDDTHTEGDAFVITLRYYRDNVEVDTQGKPINKPAKKRGRPKKLTN